jgi:hypothetical protein
MDPEVVFPQNWTPPRELTRSMPRETRMTGRGVVQIILGVVFFGASIWLGLWMHKDIDRESAQNARLHSDGKLADGEISQLTKEKSGGQVAYAFTANGVRMMGHAAVPSNFWPKVQKAGFIPIRYLPSDPNMNHPADWDEERLPPWAPIAIPAMWVVFAGVLLYKLRGQSMVASDGLPAPAVVTRCFRVKGGYAARYQFKTRDGVVLKGRDRCWRKLEPGSSACVLYLPDNPRRNYLYPLSLYTVPR